MQTVLPLCSSRWWPRCTTCVTSLPLPAAADIKVGSVSAELLRLAGGRFSGVKDPPSSLPPLINKYKLVELVEVGKGRGRGAGRSQNKYRRV